MKNIFQAGELDEKVVISILETTTEHGTIEGKKIVRETLNIAKKTNIICL
jgi:hypothetical protein